MDKTVTDSYNLSYKCYMHTNAQVYTHIKQFKKLKLTKKVNKILWSY